MSASKPSRPPKDPSAFSSNWKQLQNAVASSGTKRKSDASAVHRPRKRRKEDGQKTTDVKQKGQHDKGTKETTETACSSTAAKPEIWFDDVDEVLLERNPAEIESSNPLERDSSLIHATKSLAMDCEMVGIGKDGTESILARVSIVNQHGHCVYDKFVRPREKVTDYRTHVSGVRPYHFKNALDFETVQKEVADLLKGRVLVGHAVHNDLRVLYLDHPQHDIRDTQRFKPFRALFGGGRPSLKKLTARVLGVEVQKGEHDSIQDAQAAMRLYIMHRKRWEREIASKRRGKRPATGRKNKKKATKVAPEQVQHDSDSNA